MSKQQQPVIRAVGEDGVLVEFEPRINPAVNRRTRQLAYAIERAQIDGVTEIVTAYRSFLVQYDPMATTSDQLCKTIRKEAGRPRKMALPKARVFRIPTVYDKKHGPDLNNVAKATRLSTNEVVELFSGQQYPVYCLGFLCSLAYMGGVPKQLQLPRLTTPRTFVPAGSVGFANDQALVLPVGQPSGWHYIGRTFVRMYDPTNDPPTAVRPGDLVQCPSVSEAEALAYEGKSAGDCIVEGV